MFEPFGELLKTGDEPASDVLETSAIKEALSFIYGTLLGRY